MAVAAQRLVADTETVTELASMTQNPEFRLGMQMLARIDEQHPAATGVSAMGQSVHKCFLEIPGEVCLLKESAGNASDAGM